MLTTISHQIQWDNWIQLEIKYVNYYTNVQAINISLSQIQAKPQWGTTSYLLEGLKVKKTDNTDFWWAYGTTETLRIIGGKVKFTSTLENSFRFFIN